MLALSGAGGGSRGAISFGMTKYWDETGIVADLNYTSSVGTLNTMMYLQGEMGKLEELWLTIKNSDIYSLNLNPFTYFTNDGSLYNSKPLENLIRKYLKIDLIQKLDKPFIVSVTNLTKMRPEYKDIRKLDFESAVQWIKASASPPILFPTVTIGDSEYCDAGICSNYNLVRAIDDGADTIVLFTPTNYKPKPIRNLINIIEASISTASFNYLDREINSIENINQELTESGSPLRKVKLIVVKPPQPWDQGLIDFNYKIDRKSLIDYGYNLAKDILQKELINC